MFLMKVDKMLNDVLRFAESRNVKDTENVVDWVQGNGISLSHNICKSPPTTERPAAISLTPYNTAAPFMLVGLALEPVPVVDEDPSRVLVVSVVLQMKVPWITLPCSPDCALKQEQSTDC